VEIVDDLLKSLTQINAFYREKKVFNNVYHLHPTCNKVDH